MAVLPRRSDVSVLFLDKRTCLTTLALVQLLSWLRLTGGDPLVPLVPKTNLYLVALWRGTGIVRLRHVLVASISAKRAGLLSTQWVMRMDDLFWK